VHIIQTESLTKQFGTTTAASNISLQVNQGEIYGFLGLNGAGKTTLIRMLLGMIKPDQGNITLLGEKLTSGFTQWNNIGYLVETPYAYPNLTVTENLKLFYILRKLNAPGLINEIITRLKLTKYRNIKAKVLSMGNQQRLGLAKALMHKPKLLILDEPINGLDPEGIVEVRELLLELAQNGSTIFLSSHILGEISKVANRIGIIHEGNLIKELTISGLMDQLTKKLLIQTTDNDSALKHLAEAGYSAIINTNNEIEVTDRSVIENSHLVAKLLVENSTPPKQLYSFTEDLEMYFLRTIKSGTK
jgi:ABC-2 type transport system ATP-binding protein